MPLSARYRAVKEAAPQNPCRPIGTAPGQQLRSRKRVNRKSSTDYFGYGSPGADVGRERQLCSAEWSMCMSWPSMASMTPAAMDVATGMATETAIRATRSLCRRHSHADRCLTGMQSTSISNEVLSSTLPRRQSRPWRVARRGDNGKVTRTSSTAYQPGHVRSALTGSRHWREGTDLTRRPRPLT
jgi:hypothetical protein